MTTRDAVDRLPAECRRSLESRANLLLLAKERDEKSYGYVRKEREIADAKGAIYGYLHALNDAGIVTERDRFKLSMYYTGITKRIERTKEGG